MLCFLKNLGVAVEVVEITDGGELEVLDALSAAERNHSWVVLNKLHLATSHFLEELKYHLQRMAIAKGEFQLGKNQSNKLSVQMLFELLSLVYYSLLYFVTPVSDMMS